jgi:hypothetical protein
VGDRSVGSGEGKDGGRAVWLHLQSQKEK